MPRIIDIVRAKRNEIEVNSNEAKILGELAVAALKAGIGSTAWQTYLTRLAGQNDFSPGQLKRLLAQENTPADTDPEMDKRRVYLVANATCGINSPDTTNLPVRVNTIDEGVDGFHCD